MAFANTEASLMSQWAENLFDQFDQVVEQLKTR